MIIVVKPGTPEAAVEAIRQRVEALGLRTHVSRGEARTIIGCIGDEKRLAAVPLLSMDGVDEVIRVTKPYKLASREFAAEPTVIEVGDARIGGPEFTVIAGPCSVEGREMLRTTAHAVKAAGATMLRGGAFKPRTSPYSFRGLGEAALEFLAEARAEFELPVVTEVMDTRQVDLVAGYADVLQIGARNMQNFALLAEVGRVAKPVLLKRGPSATVQDLLLAAEYVMSHGNTRVILCERGIRGFDPATRNTFDLSAIPVLKRETHLPVIADPSHAGGRRYLVAPLAYAAIAAGADGIIVEVHPNPAEALSDGDQSLDPGEFAAMMRAAEAFCRAAGRTLARPAPAPAAA